ncbi:MAG: hypothetical protein WBP85_13455 [Terracidiphilus sp.]
MVLQAASDVAHHKNPGIQGHRNHMARLCHAAIHPKRIVEIHSICEIKIRFSGSRQPVPYRDFGAFLEDFGDWRAQEIHRRISSAGGFQAAK